MEKDSCGVVVGRFQTPELHAGHRHLLDTALAKHGTLIVVLGVTGGQPTDADPLDAETRARMIRASYPDAIVRTLEDRRSNAAWSAALDAVIREASGGCPATLYGSRDSFAWAYRGECGVEEVTEIPGESGTKARERAAKTPLASKDFRRGAIYATANRFPTSYQAVDAVIVRHKTREVLLGWKEGDDGMRFIGGFADPGDDSLEAAARREAFEETDGMELGEPEYLGSVRCEDRRYRKGSDKVMTAAFLLPYVFGPATAGDDLDRVEWTRIEDVESRLGDAHKRIWELAKKRLVTNG
jgi:bifunctional NMN adenylyltransferase/nudix hydrolase